MKFVIFIILIFSAFSVGSCFHSKTSEEDDFSFVEKHLGGNSVTAAISFRYLSKKEPSQIQEFYNKWASENGWKYTEVNKFTNGKQSILIEFQLFGNANTSIMCMESR